MTREIVLQWVAAGLFVLAIVHTFSTVYFERMAHRHVEHAGVFHLLGEVEVVFGVWAMLLVLVMSVLLGKMDAIDYLDSRNFTEPMFVFAIMIIAASKPILLISEAAVRTAARILPLQANVAFYLVALGVVPLLGSFITEPAAMTLAAILLRDMFFTRGISTKLKYATVGALFVNISIGGTLTPFAAPPVLMVAGKWGWDLAFMMSTFGWKAALAVVMNASVVTLIFNKELQRLHGPAAHGNAKSIPAYVTLAHLLFLAGVIVFSHHSIIFMSLFLFFLGFAHAYKRYQDRLILREGLLVAFFLAGLIVLGGQQQWWLQELLLGMNSTSAYFGATALTAVTDNAALTYLGSLVDGLSDDFKYSLVAGAVTGGGLTVIANAPNPAGFAILKGHFPGESIRASWLFAAALPPTLVAIFVFYVL